MPMTPLSTKPPLPAKPRSTDRPQGGFTLLELLIAVAIFALIGLAGYQLLNSVIRTYEHTRERAIAFSQLQKAVSIIEQDMRHLSRRSIRDELGDPLPAFSASYRGGLPLEFTRAGGWSSVSGDAPESRADKGVGNNNSTGSSDKTGPNRLTGVKQRIAYRLEDNQLQRLIWPVLDRAQDTEPQVQVLLHRVSAFSVRLLGERGQWQDFWPVESQQGQIDFLTLPLGIDLRFSVEGYGAIQRIFAWEGI